MSVPLTRDEVAKVAFLARLKLSDEELAQLTEQVSQVLSYVDVLGEIDTDDVEPMAHTVELSNVFREDMPRPSLAREEALSNAPKTDGKCFIVPAILDGE